MTDSLSQTKTLSQSEFRTISEYIQQNVGIQMPESKKIMVQSRLMHRLRALKLNNYSEYIDYVFNKDKSGNELTIMIDSLTTNKTEFFREADHFSFMTNSVLPEMISKGHKSLKLWSAGCSSGEEPYTLSIVLKEYMRNHPGTLSGFSLLATDISTKVLDQAVNGIYDAEETDGMNFEMKKRYFLKSKNPEERIVRVKPEIRSCVTFRQLNFMDSSYPISDIFNIIFCRNVLIYFDKPTQENIISKFLRHLEIGGYLFLGHSETIFGMDLPLETVAPTVYKKVGN
ncbi:MAG: protein-glutamate O-methyltransferase [Treponemataceae bacterium]|nr:protein-glutamate O-methyltransferase [Treponemataceae bacterium]